MKDKPVVVQVNTQAAPETSVGAIVHAVAKCAAAQDIDCRIVAGYGWHRNSDVVLESRLRYYAYALRHRLHGDDGFIEGEPTRRLLAYLRDVRPAIVHLHNLHGYYLDMPALLRRLVACRIRVVVTAHDLWWLTGRCAMPGNCPAIHDGRSGCDNCRLPELYPAVTRTMQPRYKARYLARADAGIVVPAEDTARLFRRSVLSHLPLTVIANGVDKEVFRPEGDKFGLAGKVRLVAVAAKWNAVKNAAALRRIAAAMPSGWHLTVVGAGSGIHGANVTSLPRVSTREVLARIYRDADVLLSPSMSETYGMTVYEANACGTPAIVNIEAIPAVPLVDGNIIGVPYSDTKLVLDAIAKTVGNRAAPGQVYSQCEMAESYVRLYRQLLGR